jgi:hypothetical protein
VLTGAAAAAHHHAVILVMPLLMAGMIGRWWLSRRRLLQITVARPVLAGVLAGGVAILAILPFWWWYANYNLPQAELPHPTRDGIFRNPIDAELFFWGIYGAFLVLAPAGLAVLLWRRRNWWPLTVCCVLLALLGLGTLTPLPQLLFGYADMWRWLVYERFAVWAAVLCALPASVIVERIARSRVRFPLGAVVAGALLLGVAREMNLSAFQPLQPRPILDWEEAAIVNFLADDAHASWNYVTFGLGEAEMARVSRLTVARTFDGLYYTVRQRPELRASGVGSVDSAYWWRTGMEILPQVIQHPDNWNVKWAIVAIPQLQEQLQAAGWREVTTLGAPMAFADVPDLFYKQSADTQAAFRAIYGDRAPLAWAAEHGGPPVTSLVSIWQAPAGLDIPVLSPAVTPSYPAVLAAWWGIVPLLLLILSLALLAADRKWVWALGLLPQRRPRLATPPVVGAPLAGQRP